MKTPFANFFKNIFNHKDTKPKEIHKPEAEIKSEIRVTDPPKKETKKYHRPSPVFCSQILKKLHDKRKAKSVIQKKSRIINRSY